ncbi:MAG: hypothetical protein V4692_13225, partial [Bdellovibrionota bacterium]
GSPRFAAGMMMSEESVPHSQKQHLLVDVVGGAQVKQVKIDVSYNHKKTAGQDKTANGFGIFGVYDHGTRTNWGARFEYANDVADVAGTPLPTLISNFTTFAFGPSYKFSDDVILRGDVQFGNFDFPSPTEDQNLMGASVSVLATL